MTRDILIYCIWYDEKKNKKNEVIEALKKLVYLNKLKFKKLNKYQTVKAEMILLKKYDDDFKVRYA